MDGLQAKQHCVLRGKSTLRHCMIAVKYQQMISRFSLRFHKSSSGLGPKSGPGIFQLGQPTQTIWTRVLLLIRLLTSICRKALSFTAAIFFTRLLSYTSTPRSGRPSNVYHRVGRRVYSNSPIQHAPNPSANFYRVKKCKIWPRSSTPLFFERPSFRNEATHNYQKNKVSYLDWCSDDGTLFSPNLVQLGPPLWWVKFENPPPHWKKWLNRQ